MQMVSKKILGLIVIGGGLLIPSIYSQTWKTTLSQNKSEGGATTKKHPCWFRLPEKQIKTKEDQMAYEKYMMRETYGYPTDIPLSEAIGIFNKEAYCNGADPQRPPLTEGEVIAAAIDEMVKGGAEPIERSNKVTSPQRKAALEKVWKERIMPKGSLLVASGYYDRYDEKRPEEGTIKVDCWSVYLYIGLNNNPREDGFLKPEQVCLIRKTCFGIEQNTSKNRN